MGKSNAEIIKKAIADKLFNEPGEIYFSSSSTTKIKAHDGEVASFSYANTSGLGTRVVSGNRMGLSYTEKVNEESIANCFATAQENSQFIPDDKGSAIYESNAVRSYDQFKSDDLETISVDQKKALALEIEEKAKAIDKRIVNVPEAMYCDVSNERIIANSYGLFKSEKSSLCYAYAYLMAAEGDDTTVGFYFQGEKNFKDLNPEKIARMAAQDALDKLGAQEIESGSYPVVLSALTASSLLGAFINSGGSPFFGENIQKGRSKLEGKLGETIAATHINIVDDPTLFSLGTASFDDEGVDTSRHYLIKDGVFEMEMHNIYSGKRGDKKTTGNGSRGYSSSLSTRLFTPYLEASDKSEESLLKEAGKGIYITDLEGLHAGLDQISGDFSVAAKGFLIENGTLGKAVKNITVAGNFFNFLKEILSVANNIRFNDEADFRSPSLLVKELSISGK